MRPLFLGGGTSLTFKLDMPFTTSEPLDAALLFKDFLGVEDAGFVAATFFLPAEQN